MTKLSVNLNKVALLRNSRDNGFPDMKHVANLVILSGCHGITLHPRKDGRHALLSDVKLVSNLKEVISGKLEFNLEGDIREEIISMVENYNVHQFTIVPVEDGEKTTQRGFSVGEKEAELLAMIKRIKAKKEDIRFSIFIEPETASVEYAHSLGCNAIEIHTKHYAKAFCTRNESEEVRRIQNAADLARKLGLNVNLGHDLSLVNVSTLINKIKPDEISIGHALIVESFLSGFPKTMKKYLKHISE